MPTSGSFNPPPQPGWQPPGPPPGWQAHPGYEPPARRNRTRWVIAMGVLVVAVAAVIIVVVASSGSSGSGTKASTDLGSPAGATGSLVSAIKANDLNAALADTTGDAQALLRHAEQQHRDFRDGDPALAALDYKVGRADVQGSNATVTVQVTYKGRTEPTTMKVNDVNGHWLVADMGLLQDSDIADS